jgi:cytochrome c-type biogenesis protein CcmH/NrfG
MARITLRDYNNEINDLIDHRQIDEAISHCRHILEAYPKHVDTYRLLGKAYLEEQRYGDAADILQRVLSSIPDDFISQIGMSIIREDEMNLDAAIYHMELAFESQPSNHAIQDELRRLFAKRDGIEPARIRLTRGALARMYAHGHLHEQAIAELQTALSEDPKRFDLQTLLAEMLYQADKKVESAETCTRILEKLPFNLEANRLLATILKESDRHDEAKRFQQRWEALDPYAAFVTDKITKTEQLADDVVTIEREDWEPSFGDMPDTGQPAWASSLGVSMEDEGPQEEVPDWLSPSEDELPAAEPSPLLDSTEGDWMTPDASSTDSPFGDADEQPADDWMAEFSSETPQEPTADSDDWLSEFASEEEKPEPSTEAEEEIPEFMKDAGWTESSGEEEQTPFFDQSDTPAEPTSEEEMPDWLKDMAPSEDAEPVAPTEDLGALAEIKAEPDPEWEEAVKKETGEPTPEWLAELGEEAEETPAETEAEPEPSREVDPAGYLAGDFGEDDTDDWLSSLSTDQPSTPEEEPPAEEEKVAGYLAGDFGEDDTDEWLSSLSQAQPASPEEEPPAEEEEVAGYPASDSGDDDTDDWLASLSEGQAETPTEEPEAVGEPALEPAAEDESDEWLASLGEPQEQPAEEEKEDTAMDWLTPFEEAEQAEEPAAPTPTPDQPLATLTPKPDIGEETEEFATIFEEEPAPDETPEPAYPEEPAAVPEAEQPEGLDWLTDLEAEKGIGEEELVASQDELAEEEESLPEWLAQPAEFKPGDEQPAAEEITADEETDFAALFGEPEAPSEEPAPVAEEAILEDEDDFSMDWLDSISQEAAAEAGAEAEVVGEGEPAQAEEDLSALFGETPEEPAAETQEEPASSGDEDALDWLHQLGGEEPAEDQPEAQPAESEVDELAALFGTDEPTPEALPSEPVLEDEDDFSLDWLESISEEAAAEAGAEAPADEVGAPEPTALDELADASEPVEKVADLSAIFGEEPEEAEEPEAPPEPAPEPATVEDEGLAWLESLAAKQGVAEEELVTSPDERSTFADDRTPEWLKELDEDQPADEADETLVIDEVDEPDDLDVLDDLDDLDALLDEAEAAVEAQAADVTEAVLEDDDDFSMEWLESISQEAAAEASADEVTPEPAEAITPDEDVPGTGDLAALLGEEGEPPAPTPPPTADEEIPEDDSLLVEELSALGQEEVETPEWLKIVEGEEPLAPSSEPEAVEEPADSDVLAEQDDFSTGWLQSISEEAAAEAGADISEEVAQEIPEPPAAETPEWLTTIEEDAEEELTVEDIPDMAAIFGDEEEEEPAAVAEPEPEAEPVEPEEVAPPEPEAVQPEEAAPPTAEVPEAKPSEPEEKPPTMVPEWLQEIADEKPAAEPVIEPEWLPEVSEPEPQPDVQPVAEEEWQPEAEIEAKAEAPPPTPPAPVAEEEPLTAPPAPPSDEMVKAKEAVQSGDIESAIKQFNAIIKKGKLLEEAIEEIKEALRRHPVNVELWQVLGDAYMKENNLQEALDAFSKAENLLR